MSRPISVITGWALLLLTLMAAAPARAEPEGSGLPLPRFVSLRAEEANMRAGPGEQYPIKWTYQRPGLPLEIIAEFHHWRKVRDWQGTEGWMHSSMLSSRRSFIVVGGTRPLRAKPTDDSRTVAQVENKVVGMLRECPKGSDWCAVEVGGIKGWLARDEIWGLYKGEDVQ